MRIPTSLHFDPGAPDRDQQLTSLPAVAGIYRLQAGDKPVHVAWTLNLRRRLSRLLGVSDHRTPARIANLRGSLQTVECWPTGSKLETALLLYELTKAYSPDDYLFRLRLRMPWFLCLTRHDPFPRLQLVNRIPRRCNWLFGPFRSRDAAQHYQEEVLALFQIRRCTEVLIPALEHPGCIYGEMNQCLRPCQCAVTGDEYGTEVLRVADFLASNGKGSIALLAGARDRAAEQTLFEQAAQIHKRIERMTAATTFRDPAITDVTQMNGIALTRSVEAGHVCLWPMVQGHWQDPISLDFQLQGPERGSIDGEIRERLTATMAHPRTVGIRLHDLAIFSRWYYSSWREGPWFPFRTVNDLNYRGVVREISKLGRSDPTAS